MSQADSSGLSSVPPSDDESPLELTKKDGILKFVTYGNPNGPRSSDVAPRKKSPSPPHEYVLADNSDIAVIVMFRSRFSDAFPKSLGHYGPQDIERGVVDPTPGEHVENLLCALLGLVLNRKKFVERGHHQRALEDAISTHNSQWPAKWNRKNPLSGGRSFVTMTPTERLTLLKQLCYWCLSSSDVIQAKIKEMYKQSRHEDDRNQPLSVQAWGIDDYKRRYWLIEGQDDTAFRLYRENDAPPEKKTWRSIAGTIDELKTISLSLRRSGGRASERMSQKIDSALPRFEATEEKRKRREYRLARKAQFTRPEPGFSLYEGRTRGKRMRYTFSDDEDDDSESASNRRSARHSGFSTPAEETGPTFTASGRQVRARLGGVYGETRTSGRDTGVSTPAPGASYDNAAEADGGRPRRSGLRQEINGWSKGDDHIETYNSVDEMDDEEDAASSGMEVDDYPADFEGDDDDAMPDAASGDEEDEDMPDSPQSLVVKLKLGKSPNALKALSPAAGGGDDDDIPHATNGLLQTEDLMTLSAARLSSSSSVAAGHPVAQTNEPPVAPLPSQPPVKATHPFFSKVKSPSADVIAHAHPASAIRGAFTTG